MKIERGDNWIMTLGSCIEGMQAMPDNFADVVITDPPYDEHTHKAGRRGASQFTDRDDKGTGRENTRAAFSRTRDLGFDAMTPDLMAAAAEQFARLSKRWIAVFCSLEMISDWRRALESAGLQYVRTCVWHKRGSTPQFTGDRPAVAVEAIVLAHRPGRKRWNGGGKHGIYAHPIVLNRHGKTPRLHTTQKPLELMRDLVRDFTNPGELVIDPFAGSATTGVACLELGRFFAGWEIAPNYFDVAATRLRDCELGGRRVA